MTAPLPSLGAASETLRAPIFESMNFLNEIALEYPDAISFAAGRPYEEYFDVEDIHRYIGLFTAYLRDRLSGDERQVRRVLMQYGPTRGIINELITEHLSVDESIEVDPDAVLVTVGCQEALYLTMRTLRTCERDVILATSPCYVGVTGAARLAEMPVLSVPGTGTGVDLDALRFAVRRARASGQCPRAFYVVPDFANPTGLSLNLDERHRLLDVADELDLLILEDNPYGSFTDGRARLPTLKALDTRRRVVYLGSFAKTGVPGARIGYAVADQVVSRDPGAGLLADYLARAKSMLTVNTSPIAQAVIGGKLLANKGSLYEANAREIASYRRNLRCALDALAERFPDGSSPRVTWNVPTGGFFVVLTVPFLADDHALRSCASEHGVLWTPIHHFYADDTPRPQLRLSISCLTPADITSGIGRLAEFIDRWSS